MYELIPREKEIQRNTYIHWIAAFTAFILMTQNGITISWVAPNISKLTAYDSDIPLNKDQVSWIVSICPLGGIAGSVIGSILVEFCGGRLSILLCFTLLIISWICLIVADSVVWLYAGHGIGGTVITMTFSSSIYLGEIADPEIRGRLITTSMSGFQFGVIVGSIAETYLPMKVSSSIYLTLCVLAFTLCMWLHDSPYYLVKKMKYESAKRSIKFYHANCNVEYKMKEVQNFVEANLSSSFFDKLRDLESPVVKKSLFIILVLFILPHLSGIIIILSYMEVIMKSAQSNLIKSEHFVIYANIINVIVILLTFKLIDKLGRRILLIISSIGTGTTMFGLGIHFLLLKNGYDAKSLEWLPVVCILGYLVSYTVGYSTVPSVVLSELFTDNVKSIASLIAIISASIFPFIVSKSYQPMVNLIGQTYVFWIHAALSLITIPFVIVILPETKGKTFQQIQNALIKK